LAFGTAQEDRRKLGSYWIEEHVPVKELAATAAIRAWIVDGNHCLICLIDARKVGLASVAVTFTFVDT
jgi:hypothetical protein